MSGRGFHIVTPLPKNYSDFVIARTKTVLRGEHGWYEILFDHWVTFTRRPVDDRVLADAQSLELTSEPFQAFEDLYASLAKGAKPSGAASGVVGSLGDEPPKIAGMGRIIRTTLTSAGPWIKTLDEFNGDRSRFEFSVLGTLYRQMVIHMQVVGTQRRATYSPIDKAWLLYLAAQEVLPHRHKHNERRNGRPYLLDRAASMVALNS